MSGTVCESTSAGQAGAFYHVRRLTDAFLATPKVRAVPEPQGVEPDTQGSVPEKHTAAKFTVGLQATELRSHRRFNVVGLVGFVHVRKFAGARPRFAFVRHGAAQRFDSSGTARRIKADHKPSGRQRRRRPRFFRQKFLFFARLNRDIGPAIWFCDPPLERFTSGARLKACDYDKQQKRVGARLGEAGKINFARRTVTQKVIRSITICPIKTRVSPFQKLRHPIKDTVATHRIGRPEICVFKGQQPPAAPSDATKTGRVRLGYSA